MEVDKTDVVDEDHAREDEAFWTVSRGCIHVQGCCVQGWCTHRFRCVRRASHSSAPFLQMSWSRHWLWGTGWCCDNVKICAKGPENRQLLDEQVLKSVYCVAGLNLPGVARAGTWAFAS